MMLDLTEKLDDWPLMELYIELLSPVFKLCIILDLQPNQF